ncbi:hypothetical protein [Streptomyces sp. YIM B13518]|uniref:hypothetical protein n=1 Tax=Streptomyces sp. YIM B13518 TaxID=3366316 RepID=UPI00367C7C00
MKIIDVDLAGVASLCLRRRPAHPAIREIAIPDATAAYTPKDDTLGLAWWTEDPERWDLLQKDRRDVLLDALILCPGPVDHDFARFLLDQEMRLHRHCWGFSHSIEAAALLLAEHRRPDDIWRLWQAITTSFDTWCDLPHRLLFAGGGTTRTIAYVVNSGHDQQDNLLGHLQELAEATDNDVTMLLAQRHRYYADVLREPATTLESGDG